MLYPNQTIAALQDFTTALNLNPELDEAWLSHGNALYQREFDKTPIGPHPLTPCPQNGGRGTKP
ncbi:MAG: hypothetical protein F6K30_03480 [Cyanothece sp. SIO2G6]|nr:hypothetical protein [Cyanothece sp. SIO2G6]